MDYENVNQKLGGCGLYQYILFFLLTMPTFKYAGDFQSLIFSLYEPKFNCSVNNESGLVIISRDQCSHKDSENSSWIPCTQWTYDKSVLHTSFVTEMDLVCGKAYYQNLLSSIYFSGYLCSLPLAMIVDFVGRRTVMIIALYISIGITICIIFASSVWQLVTLLLLLGILKPIFTSTAYTTLIEMFPISRLGHAASNFWTPFSIGFMCASPIAYFGRSWRYISIFSLSFSIFNIFYFCFVPETPRWLMLNKQNDKAIKTMMFIAKVNRQNVDPSDFERWKPIEQKTGRFWNLFKYKTMIYRLLIFNFTAWSFSFAYIGASTDLTFASDNIFITSFVMGLVEFPTGPLGGLLANKFSRKRCFVIQCTLSAVCLFIMPFIESDVSKSNWQPWLKLVLAMCSKLFFVISWLIFDILVSEIIPTTMRNSAMTIVYITDGLSSTIASTVHKIAFDWFYAAPCLMYSLLLMIAVVLIQLFIPETFNLPIPQTIEQSVSLVIHKEKEWKEDMRIQAQKLGMSEVVSRESKI